MNFRWRTIKQLPSLLSLPAPDLAPMLDRIRYIERNIGLPIKALVIAMLFAHLYLFNSFGEAGWAPDVVADVPPSEMMMDVIRVFFIVYVVFNAGFASLLLGM